MLDKVREYKRFLTNSHQLSAYQLKAAQKEAVERIQYEEAAINPVPSPKTCVIDFSEYQ